MGSFEELAASPVRWFARRLALYSVIAVATAVVVIAAAGVYALL